MRNKLFLFTIFAFALLLISGCADSVTFAEASNTEPVGFWYGLWHGIIAPIAWLVSLFDESTAIYAIYNNGGWYDFGFVLGAGILFGGSSSSSKK
jgi:hypothetical protein